MKTKIIRLAETDSTNRWLRDYEPAEGEEITVCVADYQTAGRGCGTNSWESERGKNLLFSLACHSVDLEANRQFLLSVGMSVVLRDVLQETFPDACEVSVKWPNDIYVGDRKIAGMLIENQLRGGKVCRSIIGVGLNVNQAEFRSDAPNPVSVVQLLGRCCDKEQMLEAIVERFSSFLSSLSDKELMEEWFADYRKSLYRREGFYSYRDAKGEFEAELVNVEPGGRLVLRKKEETGERVYAFKEVAFVL